MSIKVKRVEGEDMQKTAEYFDNRVFKMGYTTETISIYARLASCNEKLKAGDLLKIVVPQDPKCPEAAEACMYALWELYRDGFLEVNILPDEGEAKTDNE